MHQPLLECAAGKLGQGRAEQVEGRWRAGQAVPFSNHDMSLVRPGQQPKAGRTPTHNLQEMPADA